MSNSCWAQRLMRPSKVHSTCFSLCSSDFLFERNTEIGSFPLWRQKKENQNGFKPTSLLTQWTSNRRLFPDLHPADPVFWLFLDDVNAVQRTGDVIKSSAVGLKPSGHVGEIHTATGGLLHQLQEPAGQQVQRHPWPTKLEFGFYSQPKLHSIFDTTMCSKAKLRIGSLWLADGDIEAHERTMRLHFVIKWRFEACWRVWNCLHR